MEEQGRSTAYERFLSIVTAMTMLGALAGGLVLILRAREAPDITRNEFVLGGVVPGRISTVGHDDPGDRPFTEPVAVDLFIDPLTLALPPLNAQAAESPHRRSSDADRLIAGSFGHELVRVRDLGGPLRMYAIENIAEEVLALDAVVTDLLDVDRDGYDDDGRFTLTATDGSAVCVTFGERRVLATAQSLLVDPVDGVPSNGLDWTPYGPCGSATLPGIVSDVRVGTTPGTYGGAKSGDVCDIGALQRALVASPVVAASWAAVHSIEPQSIESFLAGMTPVILLRDTIVTDHGFDNGRILPRQVVLQRGNAVLIDRTGMPRVRCLSGSPLRRPQPIPDAVQVSGSGWAGFSIGTVIDVPPAQRAVSRFVLVDIRTGETLLRESGASGARSILAGPVTVSTGSG
jgi:hypothetical protein